MKTVILDFDGCYTIFEMHQVLKKSFDFPDYYGENWDALWDCLRDWCDEPTLVAVKGLNALPVQWKEQLDLN